MPDWSMCVGTLARNQVPSKFIKLGYRWDWLYLDVSSLCSDSLLFCFCFVQKRRHFPLVLILRIKKKNEKKKKERKKIVVEFYMQSRHNWNYGQGRTRASDISIEANEPLGAYQRHSDAWQVDMFGTRQSMYLFIYKEATHMRIAIHR